MASAIQRSAKTRSHLLKVTFGLSTCIFMSSHRLTFRWWGCWSLCLWRKPTELAHSCLFCSCVYFCLHGPFHCVSFHKLSQQLSAFSLCSSGLIAAILVLSTILYLYESFLQPWYDTLWLTGLKAPTNQLCYSYYPNTFEILKRLPVFPSRMPFRFQYHVSEPFRVLLWMWNSPRDTDR